MPMLPRTETQEQRDAVLQALRQAWTRYPSLRLGQLVSNIVREKDLFYIEDRELVAALAQGFEPREKR